MPGRAVGLVTDILRKCSVHSQTSRAWVGDTLHTLEQSTHGLPSLCFRYLVPATLNQVLNLRQGGPTTDELRQ